MTSSVAEVTHPVWQSNSVPPLREEPPARLARSPVAGVGPLVAVHRLVFLQVLSAAERPAAEATRQRPIVLRLPVAAEEARRGERLAALAAAVRAQRRVGVPRRLVRLQRVPRHQRRRAQRAEVHLLGLVLAHVVPAGGARVQQEVAHAALGGLLLADVRGRRVGRRRRLRWSGRGGRRAGVARYLPVGGAGRGSLSVRLVLALGTVAADLDVDEDGTLAG